MGRKKKAKKQGLGKLVHDFSNMRVSTRRKFNQAVVVGGLGAFGIYFCYRMCDPLPEGDIEDASSLGPFTVKLRSDGKGAGIALIGQQHPDGDFERAYSQILGVQNPVDHNMRDVANAAREAYDDYGTRAIFIEGFPQKVTDEYNSTGKVALVAKQSDTYIPEIASLMSSRDWYWVPRPDTPSEKISSTRDICTKIYDEHLRQLRSYESEARGRGRTVEGALELMNKRRDELQKELRKAISPHIRRYVAEVHALNNASIDAVAAVKDKYGGAVVVYGGAHMNDLHRIASEKGIPNVVAISQELSGVMDYSLSGILHKRFEMPVVGWKPKK